MSENINWKECAQDYYNKNGNDLTWAFEVVDSYIPIYYNDIAQEAMRLNLYGEEIEETMSGWPIYKVLQMLIFNEYYGLFIEEYTELLEEEE
jgi:hypothetical protein